MTQRIARTDSWGTSAQAPAKFSDPICLLICHGTIGITETVENPTT